MKTCNCCGIEKPYSEFHRHKSYKDGHRSECKTCIKEKKSTPEARARHLEYMKAWQIRNIEKVKQYHRIGHARNKEVLNEKSRSWRAQNKELNRQLVKDWSRRNPEATRVYCSRRRARIAGGGGKHTVKEWLGLLNYFNHCCAYCLKHESVCGKLTKDHVIALADGGTDEIDNIVPACGACNYAKNTQPFIKFYLERKLYAS